MMKEGPLKKELVTKIIRDGIALLSKNFSIIILNPILGKEPNLVKIGEPIVIVGDLHG